MHQIKYIPDGNTDKERLIAAMENFRNQCFDLVEEDGFEDKELASAFNNMVQGVVEHNNHFVMRINDAQIRIADNSSVKKLIEQVRSQREPIDNMKEASEYLRFHAEENEAKQIELIALIKQTESTLRPLLMQLKAAQEAVKEENANEVHLANNSLYEKLSQMEGILKLLKKSAYELYQQETIKETFFNTFDEGIGHLLSNYDELWNDCFRNGSRLYRINRDIDNARNDMYRTNSKVTLIDCTKIFAVDHLTLTWRLYYNIIEYEHLRITQLNNPDRCKFGLWCSNMDNPLIKESQEFKTAFEMHEQLHDHAVACYVAKEASEIETAMQEFQKALEVCDQFLKSLEDLAEFMRQNDIADETEVWVFQG